ncbi:MAG: M28 family peptidase [Planctomycetota bacterium]|nr:M28 family peptidase [Planctomycetota bacterium]
MSPSSIGFRCACTAWVALLGSPAQVRAQGTADEIRRTAFASEHVHAEFVEFCDEHPARLTGSAAHAGAVAFVRAAGEALGLRVVASPLRVEQTWERGPVSLEVILSKTGEEPLRVVMPAVASPWTPGLLDAVEVPLRAPPAEGDEAARERAVLISARELRSSTQHPYPDAALILVDSERPHALLATGTASGVPPFREGPVPTAHISSPDAAFLRRRLVAGDRVTIRVSGGGRCGTGAFLADPCVDLVGVGADGKSDEVVLVAVGLDSWDLGPGALADGAGVAVALQALRLLRSLERRPQRTIRFAFLGGQAQGLGTKAYAAALSAEDAARHVGGFALEGGGGRILGLALDGSEEHMELAEGWFEPVRDLGAVDVGYRGSRTGMPAALQARGIPCFALVVEGPDLPLVSGTRADVPELVDVHDLQQAACVLATAVWRLANAPEAPPRFRR